MITTFAAVFAVAVAIIAVLFRMALRAKMGQARAKDQLTSIQEDMNNAREIQRKADLARASDIADPVDRLRQSGRIRPARKPSDPLP